tara:strand:- start:5115 stop:5468 length:354 start_codon:yes stop_codon:yes gene_type:complete
MTQAMANAIIQRDGKQCHHCKVTLDVSKRGNYHLDHHPVVYRDIEDQCCLGVTDPKDLDNLRLSCPKCNIGHKYEVNRCCGQSQYIPMKRRWGYWALGIVVYVGSIIITYYAAKCKS